MWKHEQGHIVRSSAALVLKAQHKVDRVSLRSLLSLLDFLLFALLFLNIDRRGVGILVAAKILERINAVEMCTSRLWSNVAYHS